MTTRWTRRQFLMRTAGGLTLAAAGAAAPSAWAAPSPLRAGIVGLGARGRRHIAAGLLPGVSIERLCDIDARALTLGERCANEWLRSAPTVSTSAEEVFDDPAADLVVIAAPRASRARLAMAALDAGKHVYCEPPWTATSDESTALTRAAARAERVIWQGCAELAWQPHIAVDFFKHLKDTASDIEVSLTRLAGDARTGADAAAPWDVAWMDVLGPLASVLPRVPDVHQALRMPTPFGERGDLACTISMPDRQSHRITLDEQRGQGVHGSAASQATAFLSEWYLDVRVGGHSSNLWLGMTEHDAHRPLADVDLASWHGFLRAVRGGDPRIWEQHARVAHVAATWFTDCERCWS